MRYKNGKVTLIGNPSIEWIKKMNELGMIFTLSDGEIVVEFERSEK